MRASKVVGQGRREGRPRRSRGQAAVEYAVLAAIVMAALIAMQPYMKRGMAGRLRQAADSIGEQYAPGKTTATMTLTMSNDTTTTSTLVRDQDLDHDGKKDAVMVTAVAITKDQTTRTGSETVAP